MIIGNAKNSPSFLKAKTPEMLRAAMLKNNLINSKEFHYFDIQFVKGAWYAWYKVDQSSVLMHTKERS